MDVAFALLAPADPRAIEVLDHARTRLDDLAFCSTSCSNPAEDSCKSGRSGRVDLKNRTEKRRNRHLWMTCRVIRDREAPGSNPGPPTKIVFKIAVFARSVSATCHREVTADGRVTSFFEPDRSSHPFGCKRAASGWTRLYRHSGQRPLDRRCEYVGAVGRVAGVRLDVERQEGVEVAPYCGQPFVIAQKVPSRDRGGLYVKAASYMGLRPIGGVGAIHAGGL